MYKDLLRTRTAIGLLRRSRCRCRRGWLKFSFKEMKRKLLADVYFMHKLVDN